MLSDSMPDKFSIFVSDLDRSLHFYRDLLGLRQLWFSEELNNAGLRAGNNVLIIEQNPERVSNGGFRPHFTVPDVTKIRDALLEAGIGCSEVEDYGMFHHVTLSDPDGQMIGLLQPQPHYLPRMEEFVGRKIFEEV
jgi:catechol 2,3-dioxygenase-like lactoylglutathione lyase family enzyme